MIGTSSLILELMSMLFPLFIFLSAVYWLWSKRQKGGYVFVAFAGIMLFLMGTRYLHQVSNHLFLSRLSADEVARIQIGRADITEESHIRSVVDALNERKWFSSNHGGWGESVRLVIIMREGQSHEYWAGYYLRKEGAVIEFSRSWMGGRWRDGYAFSERLPAVLRQVGAMLPSQN